MTKLVLHLGQTKTGTTTLQASAFPKHPEIFYLGKYIRNKVKRGCRDEQVYEFLCPMLFETSVEVEDEGRLRQIYQSAVTQRLRGHKAVVASWESNANSANLKLHQMIALAKYLSGDCHLMFTVRNPFSWIASEYLQRVQGQFYRRNRDEQFSGRPFLSFDEWLVKRSQTATGIEGMVRCAATIKTAVSILDRERVGVFAFELLRQDPEAYYRQIAEFLDIDSETFYALARKSHSNIRLREAEFERIQEVASNAELTARWAQQSHAERREDMQRALGRNFRASKAAHVALSEEWRTVIKEASAERYRWLASEYNLPLAELGYPV